MFWDQHRSCSSHVGILFTSFPNPQEHERRQLMQRLAGHMREVLALPEVGSALDIEVTRYEVDSEANFILLGVGFKYA